MKNTLLLIITCILSISLSAKPNGTLVSGIVVSSEGKPMVAATVALNDAASKKMLKLAVTNDRGVYEFAGVTPGTYIVMVSSTGFTAVTSQPFTIVEGQADASPAIEQMVATAGDLQAVTVTNKKPLVETRIDRTVVNVEAMLSNTGSTALEVLEKSPGVMVDKDGNISIRGKQGVLVLIDGRPTYLSGADLSNMLKNMPSGDLDQIEIMTQPPARFDASGNAGVLNIKTKKSRANGFNGAVTIGYVQGRYPKVPFSTNVNWRHNKINLYANYSFNYVTGFNSMELTRRFGAGASQTAFVQDTYGTFIGRSHNSKVGLDFFANKKLTLGVALTGALNPREFVSTSFANIGKTGGRVDSTNIAYSNNEDKWKNAGVNINMRRVLDSKGSEITADADYVWYNTQTQQNNDNYMIFPDGSEVRAPFLISGNLPSDIKIYSVKADYTRKLAKEAKFEAGVKSSLVATDNNAMYYLFNNQTDKWDVDVARTNHFLYDENINAVYANYSRQVKSWGFQAGLRMENTIGRGELVTTKSKFTRNYTQFFPTVYISKKLNDKNTFVLNYGRRIERPNYQDMNPFQYFLDQFTYRQGNSYLLPQFTHNIELSHNYRGALNTSLNFSQTTDIINDILKQNDETKVTFLTKENLGKRTNVGLAISYNAPVTKWYTISLYVNPFINHFEGVANGLPLDVSLFSVMGNVNNQFKFAKTWGAEVSGFARSATQDGGLMLGKAMGVVNFAFSKQLMKNKASLRLVLSDPFWIQRFRGETVFGNINMNILSQWDNRRVGLTFNYRFSKGAQQQPQRRRASGVSEEQQRVGSGNSN